MGSGSRRRDFLLGAFWAIVVTLVLLLLWFLVTGFLGWRAVNAVKSDAEAVVAAFRAGDSGQAVAGLDQLRSSAATADNTFNSAPWSWAADFPVVGPSVRVVGGITAGTNAIATTTEGNEEKIASAVQQLKDDGAKGIAGLADLAPIADEAALAVAPFSDQVRAIPPAVLLGAQLRVAQSDFVGIADGVDAAAGAAHALPVMLGAEGARTWMVIVQNTAEARGAGGLIGAYAIVSVKDGKFSPQSAQTTNEIARAQTIPLSGIPADTRKFWGASLAKWWGLNLDRNFPFAGLLSARGISDAGSPVDDVISLDARTVAALLEVTGPVTSNGVTIDVDNAADFFTKGIYEKFPDPKTKDEVTIALTEKMLSGISKKPLDVMALWDALGTVAGEGRLLTYSTDPRVQSQLERMPTSGLVPNEPGPWATVGINDLAGSKMDAYLDVEVSFESAARCADPNVVSRIAVQATNNAPEGLPKYVDIRADGGGAAGSTKIAVAAYAPLGSELAGYSVDGEPTALESGVNRNHPTWMATLELDRGQTRTFVVEFFEPRAPNLQPEFSVQPMTNNVGLSLTSLC